MNKTRIPNSQNERFDYVIELIKEKYNINQAEIVEQINIESVDSSYISKLKSDPTKKIKKELFEQLEKLYNVNSDFLLLKSDCPFNTIGIKLENFEAFVDKWAIVKKEKHNYLYLTIDSNFYDFLLEFYNIKKLDKEGIISKYEEEKMNLQELYTGKESPKEYVLIPRNNFIEIVKSAVNDEKHFSEIIDSREFKDILDD